MFNQYKNIKLRIIFLILSVLPTFAYSDQIYDNSLNEKVFDRISIYFNKTNVKKHKNDKILC